MNLKKVCLTFIIPALMPGLLISCSRQRDGEGSAGAAGKAGATGVPLQTQQATATPVEAVEAGRSDLTSTIDVTGSLKALTEVTLSAKASGKVVQVAVHEGEPVRQGQTVIQQDTGDILTQIAQARAGLATARARLSQAITAARLQTTQTSTSIEQARAALVQARSRLEVVQKGARAQERAVAQNAVASAKASFENAKLNLERMQKLFTDGAVPKQQLDLAQTQYDVAQTQYQSAQQQLSLIEEGAREEDIEQAKQAVRQAEEAYRMAKASKDQDAMRQEDIRTARAGVQQAKANLAYMEQQLANASIKSSIDGIVLTRSVEPGEMASPGVPLMKIVSLSIVYFEATLPEKNFAQVRVGQPVNVTVDALPGKTFVGKVHKILPAADPSSRDFTVKIAIENPSGTLRPGMFARGAIQVAKKANVITIPLDCIFQEAGQNKVFIVQEGKAVAQNVTPGIQTDNQVEVLRGIQPGDKVIVSGQINLKDGQKVEIRQ